MWWASSLDILKFSLENGEGILLAPKVDICGPVDWFIARLKLEREISGPV